MKPSVTRREFINTAATAGAVLGTGRLIGPLLAAEAQQMAAFSLPPVKIHKVYVGRTGMAWPKPEIDLPAEVAKFEKHLLEVEKKLGDVKFVGGELVQNGEQAAAVANKAAQADGVLMFHLSLGTGGLLAAIVQTGKPTVIYSQPFSGHEWMEIRNWQRAGRKVALLATSDMSEIDSAVGVLRVPARMRQSRFVLVGRTMGGSRTELVQPRLGTEVVRVSVPAIIEAHKAADAQAAAALADEWIRQAKKVVEPTRDEIIKSARMYLAMKKIMAENRAQAITIECLGGIPIDILGYPCLGFARLCDEGFPGACEADIESTLTMLIFGYAFGTPGFITDPLFDLSRNAVIHAHCVSPTRMDGASRPAAPYLIRTHRDDNRGASLEVEMRVGQTVTCAKLVNLDTMLISTGKIIEIPDFDDRGCRTQIVTQVADAQKMLDNFGHGLHRVVFYGDHLRNIRHLSYLMGLKVEQET
jgi:hypothetical protein